MQEYGLTQGLTFDEADMQIIRQGILTDVQCAKLRRLQSRFNRIRLGCMLLILLILGCIGCGVLNLVSSRPLPPVGNIFFGIGICLVIALFVGIAGAVSLQLIRFNQDLADKRVNSLTGPTRIITTGTSGSRSNYVEVNGEKFPTTMWLYEIKNPGAVYRVYYLPRSKVLVAVEPVDS